MSTKLIVFLILIFSINSAAQTPKLLSGVEKPVARDPKFDNIADNTYPTVVGSIGVVTTPEQSK